LKSLSFSLFLIPFVPSPKLFNNWKSCKIECKIDAKAEEVDPEGCKVNPPGNLRGSNPERFLLIFFAHHQCPGTDGAASQVEGPAVGKGGDKDGVDDEEEEGEGARAQQGGHQGGMRDSTGPKGDHEEGKNKYEKTRRRLAGWKEKAQDSEKSEQARGDQVPLHVTCILSPQMDGVRYVQVRLGTALV